MHTHMLMALLNYRVTDHVTAYFVEQKMIEVL